MSVFTETNVHPFPQAPARGTDDGGKKPTDGQTKRMGAHGVSINPINGSGAIEPPGGPTGLRCAEAGRFARVIEIEDARRRRMTGPDQIPDEVWTDMARAAQLADELAARGQALRFDTHDLQGKVVTTLCDSEGAVLRHVGLGELFGLGGPDPSTAA